MPRPGPRPYDCIRRAWHSDRHQPMRGLLIQEIFRIVCEIHSQSTKKNTEWQEKLPVVVLRAEEIMYSKANSEAEYMDLKTLLDRTNEAINTIIRLDETTETGEYLQPFFMKPNHFVPKNLVAVAQEKRVEKCSVSKYSAYPLCYSFLQIPDSCKSKNSRPASVKDAASGITFGGCECDLSLRLGPSKPTQKRSKISNNNS
ncbi:PREDICTED: uncharacterized protein LOC104733182 [Camelina sativa]|uniref:Uncharacterized protein LOC104733182 n=1 Tax=Camelina sativa TaxID=90675 RepID=A0ABM0V5I3_CAMSA|nr:PREDICTED: uncharacterized protein LOC104733182 [Camelina sativa]